MIVARNGDVPDIHPEARVATSATIVGKVQIGARAYVDHNVVIESSGPPIVIRSETVILAGAVIRSVGGQSRPAFPVTVGERTLISPLCAVTGCQIGRNCYVATAAVVLQGAEIGDDVRVGVGAIIHASTALPDAARVGMRHIATPSPDGYMTTADVEAARAVAGADFFGVAFGIAESDQVRLHERVLSSLLEEVHGWRDAVAVPREPR
jgi:carbonic anhydrase/acetyltransferase-like protein (isoleucine patch superfamily)